MDNEQRIKNMKTAMIYLQKKVNAISFVDVKGSENPDLKIKCGTLEEDKGGSETALGQIEKYVRPGGTLENPGIIRPGVVIYLNPKYKSNGVTEMHELLHVLGFKHADNENSIMHENAKIPRDEKILVGEDIINKLEELYGNDPPLPSSSASSTSLKTNIDSKLENSLVRVYAEIPDSSSEDYAGHGVFVPLKDGNLGVLTAYHVVRETVEKGGYLKFSPYSGSSFTDELFIATFLGKGDYVNYEDIALLKTSLKLGEYPFVKIKFEQLNIGNNVLILTSNFNTGRIVKDSTKIINLANPVKNIVMDSSLIEGTSGSPVFDEDNNLVGIVFQASSLGAEETWLSAVPSKVIGERFGNYIA